MIDKGPLKDKGNLNGYNVERMNHKQQKQKPRGLGQPVFNPIKNNN